MRQLKRFHQFLFPLLAAGLTLLLQACSSSSNTFSMKDPDADFSRYDTYAFLVDVADNPESFQSIEATLLKQFVGREMEQRGFTQVDEDPDLLINFSIETQEKIASRSVPTGGYGIGYDPFYEVYYGDWGMSHTTRIDQYTEGKLNIDAIDVALRKLVWQGSTKGRLTEEDLRKKEQTLDRAVKEIFEEFPDDKENLSGT